jgi:NAD(P)H-hydrate repair Nnr-like enzyme with NAD(P)H-hydrate dehydratase domain
MDLNYWHKQKTSEPLYPDVAWSQPQNEKFAGKLLIIGGHAQAFMAAAEAYTMAQAAGIGAARVLLPDSLQKLVGRGFAAGEFAPSTPVGSFSQAALASFVDLALWSDGVLVAGDVGRNSETAIVLERFLDKFSGQVTITKDAADLIVQQPLSILQRPNTLLVLSSGQLKRLGISAHFPRAFTSSAALLQVIENLYEFTKRYTCTIITRHNGQYIVAMDGKISTTQPETEQAIWRLHVAAEAATWWLQQPTKSFEALTTSLFTSFSTKRAADF